MLFDRLADTIQHHAKLIVLVWIVALLASVVPAINASEMFTSDLTDFSSTGSESSKGSDIVKNQFDNEATSENMAIVLLVYDESSKEDAAKVYSEYLLPGLNEYENARAAREIGTYDGMYRLAVLYAVDADVKNDTGNLRSFISDIMESAKDDSLDTSGMNTYVTGTPAINYDTSKGTSADMAKVDPIAILLILVLIGLFFRSIVSSMAPPVTIGAAFAVVMCLMYAILSMMSVYFLTEVLLLVSMLGAGCDYCIFILARYREERRAGKSHDEACRQAIIWAGESVAISGMAVVIGFGSMTLCSFGMISTMGLGLALGIVLALVAALTLMSSLLCIYGDRLYWPTGTAGGSLEKGYFKKMKDLGERYFRHSSVFSIKHAKAIVIAALVFTVPMFYVYTESDTSYDLIDAMLSGESEEGLEVMNDYVDGGEILPYYLVVGADSTLGTVDYPALLGGSIGVLTWSAGSGATIKACNGLSAAVQACDDNVGSVDRIILWKDVVAESGADSVSGVVDYVKAHQELFSIPTRVAVLEVYNHPLAVEYLDKMSPTDDIVCGIFDWALFIKTGHLSVSSHVDEEGRTVLSSDYIRISVCTKESSMSDRSTQSAETFTGVAKEYVSSSSELDTVYVTGTAMVSYDLCKQVSSDFVTVEAIAIILILILLLVVMRSYITPFRSVLTILMSVVWTLAITELLFQDLLDIGVLWLVPIVLLVICLGLGMDYDILLTTRIKEYHVVKGMDNDEAIKQSVQHSGSVITLCGIIMGCTFGTLCLSSTNMLRELGFALMFAILVDALVIRTYIVPAVMHLLGEYNWIGPWGKKR